MGLRKTYSSDDAMSWESVVRALNQHLHENPNAKIINLDIRGYGNFLHYSLELEPQ